MHSLAGEHEEHTYDLLSITTLGPRQIVGGKLGSSIVQMVIYLSAVSPCLAFTYILRGVNVLTIAFILSCAVFGSLGLSVVALLVGTLSTAKHWQVVLSVLAVAGLLYAFGLSCVGAAGALSGELPFSDPEFWQVCAACLSIAAGYIALLFLAAAAQLAFVSENRSTPLRIVMLLEQLLLVGWMTFAMLRWNDPRGTAPLLAFVSVVAVHWYVMGVFMTGESPDLSLRVKRRLPQSFLGRALWTWFNPGPGTGYVFALANCAATFTLTIVGMAVLVRLRPPAPALSRVPSPRCLPGTWKNSPPSPS